MIDEKQTFEMFGYTSDELSPKSGKKVVAICDGCGVQRVAHKYAYCDMCHLCAMKNMMKHNPPKRSYDYAVRSIDYEATLQRFGYHAGELSASSPKNVIAVCVECGSRRVVSKSAYRDKCPDCAFAQRSYPRDYNMYSIDDAETFAKFGYHSSTLSPKSCQKVVAVCVECGRHRIVQKQGWTATCQQCSSVSYENRRKRSANSQGISYDEWESFATDSPYCPKFNDACRESNRDKYGRACFLCRKTEAESGDRRLSVHHVDMNKDQGCNGHTWKLVPLCRSCHAKAHSDTWKSRIEYLLHHVW